MSIVPACLGLVSLLTELLLAWKRRAGKIPGVEERDGGSLRLLWRVIGLSMIVGILWASFNVGPKLPGVRYWVHAGLGLFVVGTIIRWWAIWHLGRFFTVNVAITTDHRLVDDGPYRWVRHPSYTGLLLQFTGLALSFGNVLAALVIIAPISLALAHRIKVEEAALTARFNETYGAYKSRTKRLVPLLY